MGKKRINSRRKTSKASKKNKNQDYDLSTLDQALIAINEGNMSVRKASEVFEIPKSTLSDAKLCKRSSHSLGRKPLLGKIFEDFLVKALIKLAEYGLGLTYFNVKTVI